MFEYLQITLWIFMEGDRMYFVPGCPFVTFLMLSSLTGLPLLLLESRLFGPGYVQIPGLQFPDVRPQSRVRWTYHFLHFGCNFV